MLGLILLPVFNFIIVVQQLYQISKSIKLFHVATGYLKIKWKSYLDFMHCHRLDLCWDCVDFLNSIYCVFCNNGNTLVGSGASYIKNTGISNHKWKNQINPINGCFHAINMYCNFLEKYLNLLVFVGTESLVDLPAEISHNTYFVASSELKCLRYFYVFCAGKHSKYCFSFARQKRKILMQ